MLKSAVEEVVQGHIMAATYTGPQGSTSQITPKRKAKPRQHIESSAIRLGKGVLVLFAVLSGVWVLYDLRPKISVVNGGTTDLQNVYATKFAVTNNSTFALREVTISCFVNNTDMLHEGLESINLIGPGGKISVLSSDQTATLPCGINQLFGPMEARSTRQADITVAVNFKYPLWWSPITVGHRFVADGNPLDGMHWFEQPIR